MIACMIKIGSFRGRWLSHRLDREDLHSVSSFIKIYMIRQLTNNFKTVWFTMCGLILETKTCPSCYICVQDWSNEHNGNATMATMMSSHIT